MKLLRAILMWVGVVLAVAGGFFLLQGLGVIRWPADSFMVGDVLWVTYGAGIAVTGLLMVLIARRLPRPPR